MGNFWLHNAPAALENAGLRVIRYPGWETRSRASGGLDDIRAVFVHHTASSPSRTDPMQLGKALFVDHAVKPCGNIGLARDGTIVFGAAGAANTQGAGGPVSTSRGSIPLDQGNRYGIAIEADNNGVGEKWGQPMLDAYVRCVAVLCQTYGLDPLRDVFAHYEYAPTRKIDPAGGTGQFPYANLSDRNLRWVMDRFRQDVNNSTPGGLAMGYQFIQPTRVLDTRGPAGPNYDTYKLATDAEITVTLPGGAGKVGADVTLTVIQPDAAGFLTAWKSGARPNTSVNNYGVVAGQAAFPQTVPVQLDADGKFKLYTKARVHLAIDLVGFYTP